MASAPSRPRHRIERPRRRALCGRCERSFRRSSAGQPAWPTAAHDLGREPDAEVVARAGSPYRPVSTQPAFRVAVTSRRTRPQSRRARRQDVSSAASAIRTSCRPRSGLPFSVVRWRIAWRARRPTRLAGGSGRRLSSSAILGRRRHLRPDGGSFRPSPQKGRACARRPGGGRHAPHLHYLPGSPASASSASRPPRARRPVV